MKTFPTIVTAIFAALAIGAMLIFATYTALNKSAIGTVVIWGTLPHDVFDVLVNTLGQGNNDYTKVSYQVIPQDQFVPRLVEAIAAGRGPDLVIFPEEDLLAQADKLQVISYSSLSRRTFEDSYTQAGESFLSDSGSLGLPFTIDPLVMYWNRSLFARAGLATPPRYWDEISDIAPQLTKADKDGTLTQSTVSFGTWQNVNHAKEIFVTLLGQLGNPIVSSADNGGFVSVLNEQGKASTPPAASALRFYTDFADPTKPVYSWNRSEANSRDAFIGGILAIYFGFASEVEDLRNANPNLNFDIAPVPAIRGGGSGVYAKLMALSIPRGAPNPTGALAVAEAFTNAASQTNLENYLHLPSVRRDVEPTNPADPYAGTFRNASLTAFTFLDPNPTATDSIFQRMVENVSSGKLQVSESVSDANDELQALLAP